MLSFLLSITRKGIIGVEWRESKKSNEAGGRECFSYMYSLGNRKSLGLTFTACVNYI